MVLPEIYTAGRTVMPSLGLQYIISNLRGEHSISYYDPNLDGKSGLRDIFDAICRDFDYLAVSCNFSYQYKILGQVLNLAKAINPEIKTVAGGNHITAFYETGREITNLDFPIMGEGEESFNRLLEGGYTREKFIVDVNSLKFPRRCGIIEKYWELDLPHDQASKGHNVVNMITSRGCPRNCLFCSVKTIWGRQLRLRSPENVIAEIKEIKDLGGTEIHFEDDNLIYDKERMFKICELLKPLNMRWTCPNGIDLAKIDREIMGAMVGSGMYRITICPETIHDRILKFYRKHFRKETIDEKMSIIREFPVKLVGYFIIGAPDETTEEAIDTINYAVDNFDSADFSMLAPYIGTDLYNYCIEKNILGKEGFDFTSDCCDNLMLKMDVGAVREAWINASKHIKQREVFNDN